MGTCSTNRNLRAKHEFSFYLSDFQTSQENSVLYQDNPLVLITSVIAKLIVIVSYRFLCVSRLRVNYQ